MRRQAWLEAQYQSPPDYKNHAHNRHARGSENVAQRRIRNGGPPARNFANTSINKNAGQHSPLHRPQCLESPSHVQPPRVENILLQFLPPPRKFVSPHPFRYYSSRHSAAMFGAVQSGAEPEKYLERYGKVSISRIQHGGFRVNGYIRARPQLPRMILHQIACPSESVAADAVSRMHRRTGKQFVLIHQFQPRERIIAPPEIQRGFQQIAVQIGSWTDLMHPAPDQRIRPIAPP